MDYLLEGKETQRLHFRKVIPSDYDYWLPFHKEPQSTKYWNGSPKDPETACKAQLESIFLRYEKKLGGMNALISKKTISL